MREPKPSNGFTVLILTALLAPAALGQETTTESGFLERGAAAPTDCWPMESGSPSHSAFGWTRALRGPLQAAWTYPTKGDATAVGTPVVWRDSVFVQMSAPNGRRSIHVLRLASGERLLAREFPAATSSLSPAVFGNRLVVRSGPGELQAFQVGSTAMKELWTFPPKPKNGPTEASSVSAPLLLQSEIYARWNRRLVRLSVGSTQPVWTSKEDIIGTPAVLGDHVYAITYEGSMSYLTWFNRKTGAREGREPSGAHSDGSVPSPESATSIMATPAFVFVRHAVAVMTDGSGGVAGKANTAVFERRKLGTELRMGLLVLTDLLAPPIATENSFYAVSMFGGDGPNLSQFAVGEIEGSSQRGLHVMRIADQSIHADLLQSVQPPTFTGGIIHLNHLAFDPQTYRVRWRRASPAESRAVPARSTLLRLESGKVVAMRSRAETDSTEAAWPGAGDGAASRPAQEVLAVLRDGSIVQGKLRPQRDPQLLEFDRASQKNATLSEVAWLEDKEKRLLFVGGAQQLQECLQVLAGRAAATQFAKLAYEAGKMKPPLKEQQRELIERALELGSDADHLAKALESRDFLAPLKVSPPQKKDLEALEKAVASIPPPADELWARWLALPTGAPVSVRLALLRAVLESDPRHAAAIEAVRARIPASIRVPEPFEPLEWLEFAEVLELCNVEVRSVTRAPGGTPFAQKSFAQQRLDAYPESQFPGLFAFESRSLVILSSVRRPGLVARALALGEVVCASLREMFKEFPVLEKPNPLTLRLYEDVVSYTVESGGDPRMLFTAGHYDGFDLTRIYLPDTAAQFESFSSTYAHEITHHWLDRCGPAAAGIRQDSTKHPGFWIVEGFATLIEEFRFDPRTKTFALDPAPESLDLLMCARPGTLLDWSSLMGFSRMEFGKLPLIDFKRAERRWSLTPHALTSTSRFYVQSAALCRTLYEAEGGRHRKALLEYVWRYYDPKSTSQSEWAKLSPQAAFGMSADELGQRAMAHARVTVDSADQIEPTSKPANASASRPAKK